MSAVRVETGHKLDKQDIGLSAKEPVANMKIMRRQP